MNERADYSLIRERNQITFFFRFDKRMGEFYVSEALKKFISSRRNGVFFFLLFI